MTKWRQIFDSFPIRLFLTFSLVHFDIQAKKLNFDLMQFMIMANVKCFVRLLLN